MGVNDVVETENTIRIPIEKLLGGRFYINNKFLKRAKATGKKLLLTYKDEKYLCTYKQWMKDAKRMKKPFLIPDCPMILYGNYVRRFIIKSEPKPKQEIVSVMDHLGNMPQVYRDRIRAMLTR